MLIETATAIWPVFDDALHGMLVYLQLRQVMRQGLVRRIPVRQMLEKKFEASLR